MPLGSGCHGHASWWESCACQYVIASIALKAACGVLREPGKQRDPLPKGGNVARRWEVGGIAVEDRELQPDIIYVANQPCKPITMHANTSNMPSCPVPEPTRQVGLLIYWVAITGLLYSAGDLSTHCRHASSANSPSAFTFAQFASLTTSSSVPSPPAPANSTFNCYRNLTR